MRIISRVVEGGSGSGSVNNCPRFDDAEICKRSIETVQPESAVDVFWQLEYIESQIGRMKFRSREQETFISAVVTEKM